MEDKNIALGYEPLEQIVYRFLDLIDKGEDYYRKAYSIGISGYREMMMDVAGPVSFAIITVLANKTGKLPGDYSNYVRVGVPNSSTGELSTFTYKEDLTMFNVQKIDRLSNPGLQTYDGVGVITPNTIARDVFFPYFDYQSLGFGSVNDIGGYKIDKLSGYILFDPNFAYSQVVMEYMADVNKVTGEYMIDLNASQAVLDYIIWKWHWLKKDVSASEKVLLRREYYNQKRLSRQRIRPITLNDINDSGRKSVMSAPKA